MASEVPPPATQTKSKDEIELKVVPHSTLFYWWPVWAMGLLMTLLTYIDGLRVALVPSGTEAIRDYKDGRDAYVLPAGKHLAPSTPVDNLPPADQPKVHMASSKAYGVWFAMVLLIVVVITNVPLRGLWSVIVIGALILVAVIFQLLGWWEWIFDTLNLLAIHINAGGYLFISLVLLGVWLVTFLFFDQQVYAVFTTRQLRVRTEIGSGEKTYDTVGMTVEKQKSDLFRHWILGLGSGDLIVRTSGSNVEQLNLQNVLFVGRKMELISDLLKEQAVVSGR